MTISLIHPSRGRANKAKQTYLEWVGSATCPIEYILSLDSSEPQKFQYIQNNIDFIVNDNTCVVEATNHAAAKSTGDILLYLSDDFRCTPNWCELIIEQFEGVTTPMLLKVDDCLQRFDAPVLTIPIMNRALYEKLGYFWFPEYKSMFCDEDLYWTAKKLGALKLAPHLKFPHEHVSVGKADNDETYRRSAANWDQGKALFAKRKAAGFPL